MFQAFNDTNRYGHIIVQNTTLTLYKDSFNLGGARNWNDLPPSLREMDKIGMLKMKLENGYRSMFLDSRNEGAPKLWFLHTVFKQWKEVVKLMLLNNKSINIADHLNN